VARGKGGKRRKEKPQKVSNLQKRVKVITTNLPLWRKISIVEEEIIDVSQREEKG